MNVSICLDSISRPAQMDFFDTMKLVHEMGFSTVEFWSWEDKDLKKIRQMADELGLTISTFCAKILPMNEPDQIDAFVKGIEKSAKAAQQLNCKTMIGQVGSDNHTDRALQHRTVAETLKRCVPVLEQYGVTLLLEPLNLTDHPGYYLTSSEEGFDLVRQTNSPYVKLLFDIYHQQITEGNILTHILPNLDLIGHFHIAGVPGRHELSKSELSASYVLSKIIKHGYQGYIGMEYFPSEDIKTGLLEIKELEKTC
jgi:hydroxypyruvate isomerase